MIDQVYSWIAAHGYAVIFGLFALGIIGLPVPNELLLAYLGFLVYKGALLPVPAAAAAFLGSVCGMIFNYAVGRTAGFFLVRKFGRLIRISEEKLLRMHDWFEHRGKWALFFGYFLPGVRHLTAFAAGTSRIALTEFVFFTASGALVWTGIFMALGFSFEDEWSRETAEIHRMLEIGSVAALLLVAAYLLWRKKQGKAR